MTSSIERYFGEKVSLLSTSDVRYDGELYTADPSEQSIALKHVNCMGTEGRRTGDQVIAPSDCTYEFIIFRAVNIRDLWLEKSGGQRESLNKEVLEPLRSGNTGHSKDNADDSPKRRVGYQSRNQGGQSGGYDNNYYNQPPPQEYYGGRGGGYGPPPSGPYGDQDYPPPPMRGNYRPPRGYGAPPPYGYYDQPNGYYQRGYRQGRYQGQRQSYYQQGQRQREPQYYNQQRGYSGYYGQGYRQQDRYYNSRYSQQYDRYNQGYNGRGYNNRGYNGRGGGNRNEDRPKGQAGTGAYLEDRRLRGDDLVIKDQQEFDFDAAKKDFDQGKGDEMVDALANAVDSMALEASQVANGSGAVVTDQEDVGGKKDEEDTKENGDDSNKYDRNKSFFDGLATETKKSKPRPDLQTQKEVDTSTFGSVAATYKSRHINRNTRRQGGYGGQQRRDNYYGGGRRYENRGQRSYQQYNHRQGGGGGGGQRRGQQQSQYQQGGGGGGYRSNRWVEKR